MHSNNEAAAPRTLSTYKQNESNDISRLSVKHTFDEVAARAPGGSCESRAGSARGQQILNQQARLHQILQSTATIFCQSLQCCEHAQTRRHDETLTSRRPAQRFCKSSLREH